MELTIQYRSRPSALVYMARAMRAAPRWNDRSVWPELQLVWRGVRVSPRELAAFGELTGLRPEASLPMLVPHVIGFRLQMALLTHAAWPLPIWGALQIRNRLVQHRPLPADAVFDLRTLPVARRVVERGLEVDVRTTAEQAGAVAWESVVTFYYRGRFGEPGEPPPEAVAPEPGDQEVARWAAEPGGGLRFGRLTGDYNGIHLAAAYARRFGFARAFLHPQRVLGECLARLPGPRASQPQALQAWLKGPVYYGAPVVLRARRDDGATAFALALEGDGRPAIIGRWAALGEAGPAAPAPAQSLATA